jgi:hypothetical protein
MDQSIYLSNQEQVLNYVMAFINHGMLRKKVSSKPFYKLKWEVFNILQPKHKVFIALHPKHAMLGLNRDILSIKANTQVSS